MYLGGHGPTLPPPRKFLTPKCSSVGKIVRKETEKSAEFEELKYHFPVTSYVYNI